MSDDRDADAMPGAGVESPTSASSPCTPSPCISVCRMDQNGAYCVGCFRTLEEIAGWSAFDDARRRQIWEELNRRKAAAQAVCEPRR
jgi:uncharacterized protein